MSLPVSGIDWTPEVLPFAPRPINGELLSSWVRRLAAANGVAFPEICACVGDLLGSRKEATLFDYGAPKRWRLQIASMARIPERWVWALDLQQQFPAVGREWFLHSPKQPERIFSGFCPECFYEQVMARQILHLKAEWAVALVTRCFKHHLPLQYCCPCCGGDQPVHFSGETTVQCLDCEADLTIRRFARTPVSAEPSITSFERVIADAFRGKVPDPLWGGASTARSFHDLLLDLVWMLTTPELIHRSSYCALVDRLVPLPEHPYGEDFQTPFHARSRRQREAVVCAVIHVILGPDAGRYFGSAGFQQKPAQSCPSVEILRCVSRNQDRLWQRIRRWPDPMQDRLRAASRFLETTRVAAATKGARRGRRPEN